MKNILFQVPFDEYQDIEKGEVKISQVLGRQSLR